MGAAFWCHHAGGTRSQSTMTTVLVSGGASGIGLAVARHFRDAGADVVITAESRHVLDAALADLGNQVETVVADVTNNRQLQTLGRQFTSLDILVNCAGVIMRDDGVHDDAAFTRVLEVNLN